MSKKPSIIAQLRDLRKQRGMTQQELADKAGTTRQWIVYIESGKSSPSLATLKPILKALNAELLIKETMTDREIRELAEMTRKEKYCKMYCDGHDLRYNLCSDFCPILDIVDALHCENKIYEMAFIDGFKAALNQAKESK